MINIIPPVHTQLALTIICRTERSPTPSTNQHIGNTVPGKPWNSTEPALSFRKQKEQCSPGMDIPAAGGHPPQVCSASSPGVLSASSPGVLSLLPRCALSIPRCATSSTLEELPSPASALGPFAPGSPSSHPPASKLHFSKRWRRFPGAPRFLSTLGFHLKTELPIRSLERLEMNVTALKAKKKETRFPHVSKRERNLLLELVDRVPSARLPPC